MNEFTWFRHVSGCRKALSLWSTFLHQCLSFEPGDIQACTDWGTRGALQAMKGHLMAPQFLPVSHIRDAFWNVLLYQEQSPCTVLVLEFECSSIVTIVQWMKRFKFVVFMPPPFKEWWRGIKCYLCPCVRLFVRACVLPFSKFGVRSITFERLLRLFSNFVCLYKTSKHRSRLIYVTIHWF